MLYKIIYNKILYKIQRKIKKIYSVSENGDPTGECEISKSWL